MSLPEILKIFQKHGFNEYNCPFFKSDDIIDIAKDVSKSFKKINKLCK